MVSILLLAKSPRFIKNGVAWLGSSKHGGRLSDSVNLSIANIRWGDSLGGLLLRVEINLG